MGKISVDAFIREYKVAAKQNESVQKKFFKDHIVNDYVEILTKDAVCAGIVEVTCHDMDNDRNIIKISSISRYMLFIMNLIDLYTDIEVKYEDNESVRIYDELNKVGLINRIISAIPESEYEEFETILNMKMDDFMNNEYSITALLYNLKQELSISEDIINSAIETIAKQDSNE